MSASSGVLMVSFLTVFDIIGPTSSRSGKNTSKALIWLSSAWMTERTAGHDGLVALEHHLAGLGVDDVGDRVGTLEVGLGDLDLLEPQLLHLVDHGER